MPTMKIHLHLGVHKTATTAIQGLLQRNVAHLREQGIGYVPLNAMRERLTRQFMSHEPAAFDLVQTFAELLGDGAGQALPHLILSDENLLGTCGALAKTGQLYPQMEARLQHLRDLLGKGPEITVYLCVRNYTDFLASAYCESLVGSGSFMHFSGFRTRLKAETVSWIRLVEIIKSTLAPVELRLWRYEDFSAHQDEVLQSLAFGASLASGTALANERVSLSGTAVEFLSLAASKLGRDAASELIEGVGRIAPRSAGFPKFDPWQPDEAAHWIGRYIEDCATVAAGDWLLPPGPPPKLPSLDADTPPVGTVAGRAAKPPGKAAGARPGNEAPGKPAAGGAARPEGRVGAAKKAGARAATADALSGSAERS